MHEVCILSRGAAAARPGVNLTAWACVACDQYTSQPEYWQEAEALVGEQAVSALRLILPEIFLDEAQERIPSIHQPCAPICEAAF